MIKAVLELEYNTGFDTHIYNINMTKQVGLVFFMYHIYKNNFY